MDKVLIEQLEVSWVETTSYDSRELRFLPGAVEVKGVIRYRNGRTKVAWESYLTEDEHLTFMRLLDAIATRIGTELSHG